MWMEPVWRGPIEKDVNVYTHHCRNCPYLGTTGTLVQEMTMIKEVGNGKIRGVDCDSLYITEGSQVGEEEYMCSKDIMHHQHGKCPMVHSDDFVKSYELGELARPSGLKPVPE
jgi:hypothetical protein